MKTSIVNVIGVYPIQADVPVWLVEIEIVGTFEDIEWDSITQSVPGQDRAYWQVPYDEQSLPPSSIKSQRAAFFFHYLQLDRPFESVYGQLRLPMPTSLPERLRFIEYASPR